jgi:beta-lactamase class A
MDRRGALLGLTSLLATHVQAQASSAAPIDDALARIGGRAPGQLCVAIRDLATGQDFRLNGEVACPLHSLVKIFIGAYAAREISQGRWRDDQTEVLTRAGAPNGHGRIDVRVARAGRAIVTLAQMLEAMLVDSDNISADALTRLAGGPAAVHAGLDLPVGITMKQSLRDQFKPFGLAKTKATYDAFMADPRDCATPSAFMAALIRLANGQLGNGAGDTRVLQLMGAAWRGKARVPAGLGGEWQTFSRTGTGQVVGGRITGVHNVVIARHKHTGRKVLIVAMLRDGYGGLGAQERTLAQVGAAVRDGFPHG